MSFIVVIMDNINSSKYCVHYVVAPKVILHNTDIVLFSPTHANNHIAPKDD